MFTFASALDTAWFAVLAGVLTLVSGGLFLLALQYRRFGRLSPGRSVAGAATVVYLIAVGGYTLLPLPLSKAASCAAGTGGVSLDVLGPARELRDAAALGLSAAAQSAELRQLLLNVLLFVPFGVLGVRLLGLHPAAAVVLGLFASAAIEITQYTGIFGLFCRYRVADVGDLETNTLGALVGALLALTPLFAWIRTPRQLLAGSGLRPLTRGRRLWGMTFDLAFVGAAGVVASALTSLSGDEQLLGLAGRLAPAVRALGDAAWAFPLLVTVLPVLGPRRSSWGQRCVWLDITRADGSRASLWQALLRCLAGGGGYTILTMLGTGPLPAAGWGDGAATAWVLCSGLFLLFDRSARGLSPRGAALTPWPRAGLRSAAPRP